MSAITLSDLNDFIHPSAACIKPIKRPEVGTVSKKLDINLGDCLACSGCITSAESIIVEQQNHEELFKIINENKTCSPENRKEIVVSLSLQSIASLASKYELSMQDAAERLASFLVSLGCNRIYDINLARHISHLESVREFIERYKEKNAPVLGSVCPGWICYVEKTHGQLLIPKLSCVRSPQQIMGVLVKRLCKPTDNEEQLIHGNKIYHVTIMPCFDKKLEASRGEFENTTDKSKDVDLVLTPVELESIMEEEEVTLLSLDRRKLDILPYPIDILKGMSSLTSHSGSNSGGYAENILLCAGQILFPEQYEGDKPPQIKYTVGRNTDFIELELYGNRFLPQQHPLLKFAIVNGFRNIQTLVQRIKRNALKYDYVEVMACPSGCINGGAQSKPPMHISGSADGNFLQRVKSLYGSVEHLKVNTDEREGIYNGLGLFNDLTDRHLYTSFRQIPKSQNLLVNW